MCIGFFFDNLTLKVWKFFFFKINFNWFSGSISAEFFDETLIFLLFIYVVCVDKLPMVWRETFLAFLVGKFLMHFTIKVYNDQ